MLSIMAPFFFLELINRRMWEGEDKGGDSQPLYLKFLRKVKGRTVVFNCVELSEKLV